MGWPYKQKPPMGWPLDYDSGLVPNVGFWLMNESSGIIVPDLSGNGNTGSTAGWNIPWVSGPHGSTLQFTGGTNNAVTVQHSESLNLSSQVTVVAHFIHDGAGWDTHNTVVAKGAWDDAYGLLVLDTGIARFTAETAAAGDDYVDASNAVSVGEWIHLVGTYDGSALKIYINGVLDNTYVRSGALATNGNDIQFQMGDNNWEWDGRFSFVFIYNRALAASEVSKIYTEPFCMFKDPAELLVNYPWSVGAAGIMTTNAGYWGPTF
jgi:hypothetical protein